MEVRFTPTFGYTLLILGVTATLAGLWLLLLGTATFVLLLGPVTIMSAVAMLRRTYFWVSDRSISYTPWIGRERLISVDDSERLAVQNGRLLILDSAGHRRRVPVARWMSRGADWRAMTALVSGPPPD